MVKIPVFLGGLALATVIVPVAVSAQSVTSTNSAAPVKTMHHGFHLGRLWGRGHFGHGHRPHGPMLGGTVTSVSGSTISITNRKNTAYSVDASGAEISKGFGRTSSTGTIADIQNGDHLIIRGSLTGTSITATAIRDLGQNLPDWKHAPQK